MKLSRFAKFAWGTLAYNILVVLWGAYVRATGSGAGCGSHWPLCNGVVLPRAPQIETIIEFAHRLSSGLALILVLVLFIWGFKAYSKGSPVRLGVSLSLAFIITESLVGAMLVLFSWVAYDQSVYRVISVSVHLVNTFLLLASLTLTAWWASGGRAVKLRGQGWALWALAAGLVAVLILGISGAITALGDTLFPAGSLAEGVQQDFEATAHFLIRLRIWHPILAIISGLLIFFIALVINLSTDQPTTKKLALTAGIIFGIQLLAGLVNLLLLAPVPMQIIHLFLADLAWINLVLLSASTLGENPPKLTAAI
jgi:heme A synthase